MRVPAVMAATLLLTLAATLPPGRATAADEPIATSAKVRALPPAVRQAVLAEGKGAMVRAVLTEQDSSGATLYEVEMRIGGLTKDIVVGGDGTVLVSERQMRLTALPPAVRTALEQAAGKRPIRIVESVTMRGRLEYYEAHVGAGRSLTEIKVSPDGTLIP